MIQRNQLAQSADSPLIKYGLPVLVVIIGLAIYGGLMALSKPPAPAPERNAIPLVSTELATACDAAIEIDTNGLATARRELEIPAEVEGKILKKEAVCEVGRVVQPGTTLIWIDSANLDIEIDQLKASVQEAIGSLAELESETKSTNNQIANLGREVEIRSREYERYLTLRDSRTGAVSQNELDAARLNLVKAENSLATLQDQLDLLIARRTRLENSVELAKAQLKRAELDKQRCEIKSPIEGVIIEELIEEGFYVSPGTPLIRITDTSSIEIDCNLQIDEYQQILENVSEPLPKYTLPGNDVVVIYRANGRTVKWDGKLTRTKGLGLDETTRTMPCIVEVENPVNEEITGINTLVPGMFVKLKIQVPSETPLVQVPARALQGKNTIWVVKDGVLKKSTVEVVSVSTPDDATEDDDELHRILVVKQVDGLIEPGAQVVTTPITFQTENQTVEVIAADSGKTESAEAQSQGDENR